MLNLNNKIILNKATSVVQVIMDAKLNKNSIVVDATLGNGNDLLSMIEKVGGNIEAYGFDIQKTAIEKTKNKLEMLEIDKDNIYIINDGHENMDKYIKSKIDFVIFNLGYLPCSDHSISTRPNTTIEAINKAMQLLNTGGVICICLYPGYAEGMKEKNKVIEFCKTINQKMFSVLHSNFINQKNNPPELLIIESR